VSVYIKCNFPDIYDKVKYLMFYDYVPQNEDVLVGFENFPANHNAKKVFNLVNRFTTQDVERFDFVDKIIVMSEWQRDLFASTLSKELQEKMIVINPGVDQLFFKEIAKQPYNITYAGSPAKGAMPALVRVLERLKSKVPQAHIHAYGGGGLWGWDNDQYRPVYDKLIKSGVLYHGQIGKEEMPLRLGQAQIFLYPVGSHHKETFCLAVLEAMAAGCVVVASDSGNVKNLVADRGLMIAGDINHYMWSIEAVEKITKLFENPTLLEQLSSASREFARNFTWENTAINFEKLI
jgi:glycosyltransferase involved in cell wall biosynthesis